VGIETEPWGQHSLSSELKHVAGRKVPGHAVGDSSQPALQIRYPTREWRESHGDLASTKTKNFIAICQSTRPVRDTDRCKAEGAETGATKRALATFGNPFGLALYDREWLVVRKVRSEKALPPMGPWVLRLHPVWMRQASTSRASLATPYATR
jgi:Rad52/22 family double-strand break repair protein